MGVDAEMLVKVQGRRLTDKQVKRLGYEMACTLGHKTFFIARKDPGNTNEYLRKLDYRALEIVQPYTKSEADENEASKEDRRLIGKVVWWQDGDPIIADEDEQFLKVRLYGRYYGPGYERGDWPKLRAVIDWLYFNIQDCEVWYGGDSSGICAEHMTPKRVKAFDAHFHSCGHEPYVGSFTNIFAKGVGQKCLTCEEPMRASGGGQGAVFLHCDGCGAACVSDGKAVVWAEGDEDIFKTADRFRKATAA